MALDDSGYERLFHAHYATVLAYFRGRGFNPEEAADLTQDVFVRVYTYREGFRGEAEKAWILVIAGSIWKNELRHRAAGKRQAATVSWHGEGEAPDPADTRPDPEAVCLDREARVRLRGALAELPPQGRRCAELYYLRGRKYREIATLLDVSIGTVKSHLNQARERLQGLLHTAERSSARRARGG